MKRLSWLVILLLLSPVLASERRAALDVSRAAQAAAQAAEGRLGTQAVFRLRALERLSSRYANGSYNDFQGLLRFFSQTRQVVWSDPRSPQAAAPMRRLEEATLTLAAIRNYPLDLPPIGPSSSPAYQTAAPPEPSYDRNTLVTAARQADQLSQQLWGTIRNRPQLPGGVDGEARQALVGVAETSHAFRVALEEGGLDDPRFHSLSINRARLLFRHRNLTRDEGLAEQTRQLLRHLDVVVAAYRFLKNG